jgi:hypothetical protein
VRGLALPSDVRFESVRRFVRENLAASKIGPRIDSLVSRLLPR